MAFDTSGPHVAAAVWDGARVFTRVEAMAKGQAERLFPLIQDLMAQAGRQLSDIDRIAVGTGPGNFTGVRISISAARGLALGLGVPAVGVSLFQAQAHAKPQTTGQDGAVMIPAPRGMIYAQTLANGQPTGPVTMQSGEADPIDPQAIVEAMIQIAPALPSDARPAPLYARPADATPPSDPPPVILDA